MLINLKSAYCYEINKIDKSKNNELKQKFSSR